ncbi:MAG: hypothetical protein CVU43_24545 [Chloroflexi bacterium HGW-Chloroflexi-5]|nr:MAG: hypothetical protein CVU43_24545 [Chloroflexi bacterium HGW-Chloroflexi-5]
MIVGLARLARYFLLFVQKKVPKEKDIPCHGLRLPCAAHQSKRLRNSAWQLTQFVSCCGLQTVLAENSWIGCAARHGSKGEKVKSM